MAVGKNIKGITIEFAGDTTKLGKALNDVNKKTRDVDKSLKQVDNALKFNPKNTELLAQKQQLLGDKIGATKDKLTALKQAQAKLDDDPAVDKTSQDYMELRREIITTESKLKHFEGQLKELNNIKFDQLGKKVQDVGDKVKTVGDNMTKYVTGPIVAAGAGSIKAFNEVDAGLDIVTQKTGATGDALTGMHDIVKNLAGEIPTDFETIGTAVGEVSTRFGVTGQELEDLSSKFLQFAQINGIDVNQAVDTTQKALSAFGLSAEDAGPLLDRLNKVGQDTGASMEALLEGLVQNGTAFQELGLNAEQSAILMGQLETSGANSETVMQGLRKALKNAAKEGIPFDQALSDLQNTIVNGTGDMDGLTAAYDLFGKSGDQIYGAIKNGTINFEELGKAASDAGGSVENTFNETLDPVDKFNMMMNDMKVLGYEVGSSLLEAFGPTLERLAKGIQGLAEKWNSLSPGMQDIIIKGALVVAALGPVLSMIGRMTIGIGGLITVLPKLIGGFSTVMGAFGKMASALLTNPWVLVAAAAIAAIVLIVKNWDKIKEFFAKLWENIKEIASVAWSAIKDTLVKSWNDIKELAVGAWEGIKSFFTSALEAIKNVFTTAWNAIKTATTTVFNGIKKFFVTIFNAIKIVVTTYINAYKKIITTAFNIIKTFFVTVFNGYKRIFTAAFNGIKNVVTKIFNGIKNAITKPIQKAADIIKNIVDKIKSFFDFKISLPHIKLPHFSISPKGWKLGDLLEGSIPSLGIDWYAKGGIFKSPSVIGVGEKGPEAVLPIEKLNEMLTGMADSIVNGVTMGMALQNAGQGRDIIIENYLYKNGPQMGEVVVKTYDQYKKILG